MLYYNKNLKSLARELRKNMTDAEKLLWSKVRRKQFRGYQFYRQRIIGNYIVDFYCPKSKLVIEIDGGQHYSEVGVDTDRLRDKYITDLGLRVLRFTNLDVLQNIEGILEHINENLKSP
ncbi:MAG: endonuclease domain-containing protein [Thermodesulfobacteriota bacterium]